MQVGRSRTTPTSTAINGTSSPILAVPQLINPSITDFYPKTRSPAIDSSNSVANSGNPTAIGALPAETQSLVEAKLPALSLEQSQNLPIGGCQYSVSPIA
jgi:hypothetical protein